MCLGSGNIFYCINIYWSNPNLKFIIGMSRPVCGICKLVASKYTCPVCCAKYCSVTCYKTHKASVDCVKPTKPEDAENQPPTYQFETDQTVKPEQLALLRFDKKVRNDLENRHLRKLLKHLNSSENPDAALEEAMKEPLFHELTVHCLKAIESDT